MTRRNENRPGYKMTRVGWIPEEWECALLGEHIHCYSGGTPSRAKKEYFKGSIPWIKSGELNNQYITKTEEYISEDAIKNSHTKVVERNTLLYALYGATAGIPAMTMIKATINQAVLAIIPRKKLTKKYLFFWLWFAKDRLLSIYTQGGQPNLSSHLIKAYRLPLPPLPEQKKIAEILSTWDRAIEQLGGLIDAKARLKKGLMQQLLTGRMRFPEFGKPVHEKGELPEGWKKVKLGECFKERKETAPTLPLLAITSGRGVIPRNEVERKDTSNVDKSKYKRIAPYDIGYNTMRMWQGVSAVSTLEGIVSPAYTICTPKEGHSSIFFGYLFKYPHMVNLFHRFSQGLVSDTLNLKFRHFSQVKTNIPTETEQTRISSVLSACDREVELLKKKQEQLKTQKRGLMQKLLTGEVRVNLLEKKSG